MEIGESSKRKDSAVDTIEDDYNMVEQNGIDEDNNTEEKNQDGTMQPETYPLPSVTRPRFTREMSAESSMTFCNAEQSMARRKQRVLGLFDRPILWPPELQAAMSRPEETGPEDETSRKRRKTITPEAQAGPNGTSSDHIFEMPSPKEQTPKKRLKTSMCEGQATPNRKLSDHTFVVPPLPLRLGTAEAKALSRLELVGKSPCAGLVSKDAVPTNDEDVDMSDTIVLAKRHTRTAEYAAPVDATSQTPTAVKPQIDDDFTLEDPDTVDLDSGLKHDPKNRGENDQTGVTGERNYQTIQINDMLYTVDRSRAHINIVQPWKTWTVTKDGGWHQYKSHATLRWTDADDLRRLNTWRENHLLKAGFPPRQGRRRGEEFTAAQKDWLFEFVMAAEGGTPSRSMVELTRQLNKRFVASRSEEEIEQQIERLRRRYKTENRPQKPVPESGLVGANPFVPPKEGSGSDKSDEIWNQDLTDRARAEPEKYDGQQKPTLKGARTLRTLKPKSQVPSGEEVSLEEGGGEGRRTASQSSGVPLQAVTRAALLSQFQARTGEMQKSREQSQESSESKGGGQY